MVNKILLRKLYRDLLQMKLQVFSISLVVSLGSAILIGFTSTFDSLQKAQSSFYQSAHFSDYFVLLKRAPMYVLQELSEVPGIIELEARLEFDGLLNVPGFSEMATAHLISIPDGTQPKMSRIHLKQGQMPSPLIRNEVIISEGFFTAHKLKLGDFLSVSLNGKLTELKVVGVGVSPEQIMPLPAGSPMPDDLHFAVFWVQQSLLEMRYDMKGAFNFLLIKAHQDKKEKELITNIESKLSKYGALNVYSRAQQVSHMYVNEELKQLRVQATILPIIFFLVAAFVLNVVMSRLIQTQRSEIATFKALGIADFSIANYYFLFALVIVSLGSGVGSLLGYWIGKMMTSMYTLFYHFPVLIYELNVTRVLFSFLVIVLVVLMALINSLQKIFVLSPAEAMRPANPAVFHKLAIEKSLWFKSFDPKTKMMLRGLLSHPLKTVFAILGLSFTVVLMVSGLFWQGSMDYLIYAQYGLVQKESGQIQLTQNLPRSALLEIQKTPGVIDAEGYRAEPVEVVFQTQKKKTSIRAYPEKAKLQSLIDDKLNEIPIPQAGIYLSKILARQLGVQEGDQVEVQFLQGKKERLILKVNKVIDSFMSSEIITSEQTLSEILKEDKLINTILFRSIENQSLLYSKLKEKPFILSVSFKDAALKVFEETSAKFLLVFAFILSLFAAAIGFGVAYNNLQISFSERDWELASLEVLGFYPFEAFKILISEMFLILILAIPFGWLGGWGLSKWMLKKMMMESFQIPFVINPSTFFYSAVILIIATLLGAALIFIKIKKMDMIATLKTRG